MKAHKFLAKGALGPLSGFAWPAPTRDAPGAWVEADGPLAVCARGVHVCRAQDLAHWIHDELWEVEADGGSIEGVDCIVVARARLVRRIDTWGGEGGRTFATACVDHASLRAGNASPEAMRDLLEDARYMAANGYVALAAYTAALVVSRASSASYAAYRSERAWQSAWIARSL
jgi:hypothetical protein